MNGRSFFALMVLAIVVLNGCQTQRPVDAIRVSGDRYYDLGNYAAAAEEYEAITARYPGDWRAQYHLGLCLLELDRPNAARRALEIAHTQRPRNNEIADALAEALFQLEDEERLHAFLRDRAETRQTVHAWRQLARYSMEMGDPDSARLAIETAIELDDGESVEPYLDAAEFAERLGVIDLAVRRLSQAYGINPHDQRVRERLRSLGEVPGPSIALPPGR